jgi:hypothetical protein
VVEINPSRAFYSDNARNEDDGEIVEWFVANETFEAFFAPRHTIVYGSRGSGKTFLSKMASFPLMSQSVDPVAKRLISELKYIGMYLSTDVRFVGSTKNTIWIGDDLKELHFIWKMNIASITSFALSLDSLLLHLFPNSDERLSREFSICADLQKIFDWKKNYRLSEIPEFLSHYEFQSETSLNRAHLMGEEKAQYLVGPFCSEIFHPLSLAISITEKYLSDVKGSSWLLFIDEAEYMLENQKRIINSFMRTQTNRLFLKIVTLPFHYDTFETNLNASLQKGDDYNQIFIDAAPIYTLNRENSDNVYNFARRLFKIRVETFFHQAGIPIKPIDEPLLQLDYVLFGSKILRNKIGPAEEHAALMKLERHLDGATFLRAKELFLRPNRKDFYEQIWRKVAGLIRLRESIADVKGSRDAYSGIQILIRATDGIPRRMINIFERIMRETMIEIGKKNSIKARYGKREKSILPYRVQNRIASAHAEDRFKNSLAVAVVGPELNALILAVGRHLCGLLHDGNISSDYVCSFHVDSKCSSEIWRVVQEGVAYGHIFPNVSSTAAMELSRDASFRLSYAYCAMFDLFPTQGKKRALSSIIDQRQLGRIHNGNPIEKVRLSEAQLRLF